MDVSKIFEQEHNSYIFNCQCISNSRYKANVSVIKILNTKLFW